MPTTSSLPPRLLGAVPLVGGTLRYVSDPSTFMATQLERHGPVSDMRFLGQRWTTLIGPEACSIALRNPDKAFANGPGWGRLVGPFFDGGLMLLDFEEHHRHRRALQQAFTRSRIETYTEALSPAIHDLVADWPAAGSLDVYPALKSLTLDVATRVFMGASDLSRSEQDRVNRAFVDCVQAATALVRLPVPGTRWGRALAGRRLLESFLLERLPRQRARDGDDLFTTLCTLAQEDDELTDMDVVNHMIFLLMAAHDTSTLTVSTAVRQLGLDQGWQERLRAQAMSLPQHPTLADLDALHDFDLVVKECLRMVPPVPVLARRTVKDTSVLGVPIPAGRMTAVMLHHQHQDPQWWSEPDRFDPERFAEPRREDQAHRHAWEPFGGGVHKCLGMFFAGAEVKLLLIHLLRRFRWDLDPNSGARLSYASLPFPVDGQPVLLRPVEGVPA